MATLIDEGSESHHGEVVTRADPNAFWPQQTGLEMFDIATVCLRHKPKLRPPMEQVHFYNYTDLSIVVKVSPQRDSSYTTL